MKTKFTVITLLAVSICATIISCNMKENTTPATTTAPATGARAEYIEAAPNVRLHVTDLGNGPAVILIHGYPLSDASWEYQYHDLINAGYRVIGITLRGFGQSDKPFGKYDYDTFAADIKAVLDQLDIKDATIGGHSMGGAIALHYVAKYNAAHISKLALFAAAAPVQTKRDDFPYPLYTKEDLTNWVQLNNTNRPALLAAVGEQFTLSATSIPAGIGAWLGSIEMQSSPYAMEQALIALRDEDLRADLPKIKVPTVLFHAPKDRIVAYAVSEQMQKAIPGAVLIPFENSGHALFIEEKDKFNQELIKFLKQ